MSEDLLKSLKEGDPSAYRRLFKEYYKVLVDHASYQTKNRQDAEDVVSEVFKEIYIKKTYLKVETNLHYYLLKHVSNKAKNFMLSRSREYVRNAAYYENRDQSDESAAIEYLSRTETQEKLDVIRLAIDQLPAKRKESVILRYIEDLSYEHIAHITGTTIDGVKSRLKNGVRQLGEMVGVNRKKDK
ncbi:RNA polymerase sigma factor [Chitinophaga polysaccharea]|uniref:RNA polymerase sigma factor n=1 Tax=Chitinophaga polysaccharea TaxID=1293035 RepID=UPI001455CC13|nr:RNA polymerase sigma factor [Chitinophaga polysaccharea]NLR60716.1 RNA polymerase sigma factor [Chitinophaga polysaccharea]